jgi:hypothetical protein
MFEEMYGFVKHCLEAAPFCTVLGTYAIGDDCALIGGLMPGNLHITTPTPIKESSEILT